MNGKIMKYDRGLESPLNTSPKERLEYEQGTNHNVSSPRNQQFACFQNVMLLYPILLDSGHVVLDVLLL